MLMYSRVSTLITCPYPRKTFSEQNMVHDSETASIFSSSATAAVRSNAGWKQKESPSDARNGAISRYRSLAGNTERERFGRGLWVFCSLCSVWVEACMVVGGLNTIKCDYVEHRASTAHRYAWVGWRLHL